MLEEVEMAAERRSDKGRRKLARRVADDLQGTLSNEEIEKINKMLHEKYRAYGGAQDRRAYMCDRRSGMERRGCSHSCECGQTSLRACHGCQG